MRRMISEWMKLGTSIGGRLLSKVTIRRRCMPSGGIFTLIEGAVHKEIFFCFPYTPKGGGAVWTCVNNHIINEKEKYESIGIRGFYYTLFEEEKGGGTREGLYGYPYLKH